MACGEPNGERKGAASGNSAIFLNLAALAASLTDSRDWLIGGDVRWEWIGAMAAVSWGAGAEYLVAEAVLPLAMSAQGYVVECWSRWLPDDGRRLFEFWPDEPMTSSSEVADFT